ncbi:MAG: sigma-70 family RNA polymerase sigma factor [Acidimicrobiales bacterium]
MEGSAGLVAATLGPGEALAGIYRECFGPLMRVAFLLTGSNTVAEDVVHDVFMRCGDRLGGLEHPPSYLRAAVVSACRSHHRQLARRGAQVNGDEPVELPHDLVELRDALAQLSPRRRAAVVLRYHCDLDFDEIGEVLGCRAVTVRSLVHRGVKDLRGALR